MKSPIAPILAAALVLGSCASAPRPGAADAEALSRAAAAVAAAVDQDPEDLPATSAAVEAFFRYLAEARPGSAAALAAMRDPAELAPFLESAYGTTPYEQALEAFMSWDRTTKGPAWSEKRAERLETDHFVIVTMPGSAAHRDRAYLARLAERRLAEIADLLVPDPTAPGRTRLARNFASLESGRVELVFPPSSKAFAGFGDTANANWGFALRDTGLAVTAVIRLPYYNALSSAILTHELTHIVDIFCKLDLDSAPPVPAPGGDMRAFQKALGEWAKPVFEAIVPNDKAFGEGVAEYAAARLSPLHRAFFGDPDALLKVASRRVPLLDDVLAASPSVKDRRLRLVRYAELASLVSYAVERYGLPRFLEAYMSVPFSEEAYAEALGVDFRGLQEHWKAARGF